MKRSAVFAVLLCAVLFAFGCTSKRGIITLNTLPQGADVYVDGARKGSTPLNFEYDFSRPAVLKIEKEGYQTEVEELHRGWITQEYYKGNFDKEYVDRGDGSERVWKVKTLRALREKEL